MAQLIRITSEALQATIRRLLPSQQGFGEDLQASNVITPIIDVTPTAEGSQIPTYLQQALNLGGATDFLVNNATTTLTSTPGFYRVTGTISGVATTVQGSSQFNITDGLSTKTMFRLVMPAAGSGLSFMNQTLDFTVFLRAGDSLVAESDTSNMFVTGSLRQVADVSGNLVNPSGFTFE